MGKFMKGAAFALGLLTVAEAGGAAYFYRRTMKRNKAKVERTIKMSGTDWAKYYPLMEKRKEYVLAQTHRDVSITSFDGLKLHATYFPAVEEWGRREYFRCKESGDLFSRLYRGRTQQSRSHRGLFPETRLCHADAGRKGPR